MKDRDDLQVVVGRLVYQALVSIAEVDQRLATHLNLRELVAQGGDSGDAVPDIVQAKTGQGPFLRPLIGQGVQVVIVRKEQALHFFVVEDHEGLSFNRSLVEDVDVVVIKEEEVLLGLEI